MYECWKKGICVPARGATTRSGVRYRYRNMREGGECSGDRVEGRGGGRIRRRDRDTWRVREIFFFALCCLGKIPGGAPFSQLHKSGNGSRVDRP